MDEVAELIENLSEIYGDTDGEGATISAAATKLGEQQEMLQMMHDFVGQYREEFEESLSYEQQEMYRAYFGLDHSSLGESLFPNGES